MRSTVFACAAAVAALALAPVANADPDPDPTICSDNQGVCAPDIPGYLSSLANFGITGNNSAMINVGMKICADIAHGTPAVDEAASVRSVNQGLSLTQGNQAVDVAQLFLCPQIARPSTTLPIQ